MKTKIASLFLCALALGATSANAGWIDWTSTTTGTMTIGSSTVNVSLSGNPFSQIDGDTYYNNASTGFTSVSGTYAGMAPSDFLQIYLGGTFTLTFDQSVQDLYMSLISVGQPNLPVTYAFNDAFSVISAGANFWGYNGYSVSGNNFTGTEYNGILHFTGAFNSITFTISPEEYWHGFNFGSFETTNVPEPTSLFLLGLGLICLGAARKRTS